VTRVKRSVHAKKKRRATLERAKGLLMAKEGLTEQEAFERLRRASQLAGRPLKVVADALIATFES